MTWAVAWVFRPRVSLQVAVTVIGPLEAADVSRAAELPLPEMLPPLAVQPPTVTWALSGLVQVQRMVEGVPVWTVDGFAEQETAGGFLGGCFTVKVAMQLAALLVVGS